MQKSDNIEILVDFFTKVKCTFKVKLINKPLTNNWDDLFIQPEKNYVEFGQTGPVTLTEVEWIYINPIEQTHVGKLVPDRYQDHTYRIKNLLDDNAIKYTVIEKTIRVYIH